MIENGQEVYIVQINMAEPDQNPDWDNMGVYQDYQQALAHIEWCKGEYGDTIEFRVDVQSFYTRPNMDSWIANPDRSGGQFTQDEIDNHGRWI